MAIWNTTFLNPEVHTPPTPTPTDPEDTSWWDDLALFENVWDAISTVSGLGVSLIDKGGDNIEETMIPEYIACLLYTSPSPRDRTRSRMPSSA